RASITLAVLLAAAVIAGGTAMHAQSSQPKSKAPAKSTGAAQTEKAPTKAAAKSAGQKHVVLNASDMQWGPGPDSLPAGLQISVLGPFAITYINPTDDPRKK